MCTGIKLYIVNIIDFVRWFIGIILFTNISSGAINFITITLLSSFFSSQKILVLHFPGEWEYTLRRFLWRGQSQK